MILVFRNLSSFFAKAAVWLAWQRVKYELRFCYPELGRVVQTFQRSPEAGWAIAENDVLQLYRLVLTNKPEHVLELGTGIGLSTAVVALALKKLGRGQVVSLEQLPKCIEIANALIDRALKPFVKIIHTRPTIFRIEAISKWIYFCGYDWKPMPDQQFDFVFIDGPSGWIQDGELVSLDAGDIFRLLPHLAPGAKVYIDGRRSTVKKIRRYLGRYLALVKRDTEFALFERTRAKLASLKELVATDTKLHAHHPTPYVRADVASTDD